MRDLIRQAREVLEIALYALDDTATPGARLGAHGVVRHFLRVLDEEPTVATDADLIELLASRLYSRFGNLGEATTPCISGSHIEISRAAVEELRSLPVDQHMAAMGMEPGGWSVTTSQTAWVAHPDHA